MKASNVIQLLLLVCCLQTISGQYANNTLNKYIHHHEGLSYDTEALRQQSLVKDNNTLQLDFHAHGRHFNLQMQRDTSTFSPNLTIKVSGEDLPLDISYIDFIYTGETFGENGTYTYTHGSVIDGRFEGSIKTHAGTYYVEPSERYFSERNVSYHSVIYHEDDISHPKGSCANHSVFEGMWEYRASALEVEAPVNKLLVDRGHSPADPQRKDKTTCELLIQTDHLFYNYYGTKRKVMDEINSHVKTLNSIFQKTDFNGIRNVNFVVKRIIINTTSTMKDTSNPFRFHDIGGTKFLELFSRENHDSYCLAYAFTYRDFEKGVTGKAWKPEVEPKPRPGGICEKHRFFGYDNSSKSLNTGVITVKNYDRPVPPKASHIALAHEVGHSFGSPHDDAPECTPGGQQGNYIMFPYQMDVSGDRPNHRRFSPCSINAISEVLKERMKICFVEPGQPICGNGLVEKDEECDCGYSDQCEESCCYNADEDDDKRCKLKPGKACSPSQGSCCDPATCDLKPKGDGCRLESECVYESRCNGTHVSCPPSQSKADFNTTCNGNTQVCLDGVCAGSICQKYGLDACTCPSPEGVDEKAAQCYVCCMEKMEPDICQSTGSEKWADFFKRKIITLRPGSPCNDHKGYCDMFSKCRPVNADGPLLKLLKSLFNPELYKTIGKWMLAYWWAVIFICIAFFELTSAFVRICSVQTPSSDPNKPPPALPLPGTNVEEESTVPGLDTDGLSLP